MSDSQPIWKQIQGFTDVGGRIYRYPAKRGKQLLVLHYLAEQFEPERQYSEKEVNQLLQEWHTFNDWALLRRDLSDAGYLCRSANGEMYTIAHPLPEIGLVP